MSMDQAGHQERLWTQQQLEQLADQLSRRFWDKPCAVPVAWNGRLKKTMGRFMYHERSGKREALKIELSTFAAKTLDQDTFVSVLLHELCHYHLFLEGKPFEDHHPLFEQELKRVGAASTNTIQLPQQGFRLICSSCKRHLGVRKRINTVKYRSTCCGAKIQKERCWL